MKYSYLLNSILKKISAAWIVLIISLMMTLWSAILIKHADHQQVKDTIFDYRIERIRNVIINRMSAYQQILEGGVGLFSASVSVERNEWHEYVKNLHLGRYPGIQSMGFIKRVLPPDKESHIAEVRAEGGELQNYTIEPEGDRDEYMPVLYLESWDRRNQQEAIGYDAFSDPVRREAMERARDTGEPALSGKVTLIQEITDDVQIGFTLYTPVYRNGYPSETVEEKRAHLIGYVYSPFSMNDLLHNILVSGILGKNPIDINLHVYDGKNLNDFNNNDRLMYEAVARHRNQTHKLDYHSFTRIETITVAGHSWTLRFDTLPPFDFETKTYTFHIVLLSGFILSFLLFWVIRSLEIKQLLVIQQENNSRLQQEITERQHIEAKLRASEERFELAMQGSNDGLWDWDLETDVVYQSPRLKQMLGFDVDEWYDVSGSGFNRIHPNDLERVSMYVTAYLEKKIPHFECTFRIQHKNGYYLWIMSRAVAVWNEAGYPVRMVGTHTDLTTLNLTEEALRRSEEKYRRIAETSQEGIWMVDDQAKTTYVNARMAQMLGYSEEEILDQSIFNFMDESAQQEVAQYFEHCRQGISEVHDFRFRRQEGSDVWVMISTSPMSDKAGNFLGSLSMITDITERKRFEEELKQAKQVAEAANRAKSVFLANMSHELRTPLNSILGFAQILNHHDQLLTKEQQQGIDIIQQSGEYLLTLINDVLDLAKVEAGKIELSPTVVILEEFLQEIIRLFESRAKQKGLILSYQALSALPVAIEIDEKRLRQVLINLLGNTFKFTEQGYVALKVTYHQGELYFHVEDSGCGIAADDLEKIFMPFQQVGNEEYRKQGTGLGLAITKGLIEMMGGTLRVTSVLGQGSTFSMSFKVPEVPCILHHESQPNKMIGYQGERRTILIIDDNQVNRMIIVKMLTYLGFTVLEAKNGQEGLDKVNESPPFDLILVDLVMPGLNGFSVIEQLKANPCCQQTVLIAISASAFESDRQKSLQLGCNDFIAKPIKRDLFLERLRIHLNLIWLYEAEPVTATSRTEPLTTLLTSSQAANLLELTKQGDIMAICDFAKQLEHADEELAAVARYIHELAIQFKTSEIRKIAQKHLT